MKTQPMYDLTQSLLIGIVKLKLSAETDNQMLEFVFVDVDSAFEALVGLTHRAIVGRKVTEVFPWIKTDAFDWMGFFAKCAATGETRETLQYIAAIGRWCRVVAYLNIDAHIIVSIEDKTRELRVDEELGELDKYRAMFEQHSAVMLLSAPLSGKIIHANAAACAFYGYSKEAFRGLSMRTICPDFDEALSQCGSLSWENTQAYSQMIHRLKNGETRVVDVYSSPVRSGDSIECLSIIIDMTSREQYKQDLYTKEAILSITLNSIGDGVVTTNKDGLITLLNKSAQEITGWDVGKTLNKDFAKLFQLKDGKTGETVDDPVGKVLRTGNIVEQASHIFQGGKDGGAIPIADSAAPIRDEQGNIFGAVMVFRDMSQDMKRQEEIRYLSRHDALTGLYNRSYIMEVIRYLDTPENMPITVIIGDVNGLKLVNDAFGHGAGDTLLKKTAAVLRASCRGEDIIARWGEDEFMVLLPGTSTEAAERITQRLMRNFEQKNDGVLQFSVSLGYAVKQNKQERLEEIMMEAEKWMSHRKLLEEQSYRNTIMNTLLATLYERNIEAEEHSKRLERYCLTIGRKVGLAAEQTDELSLLAMLHDIGKIGINQNILQKPGPLSESEWSEMKRHCEIGHRIIKNMPELSTVADYILLHHERWDGNGYPMGCKGQDIPLACRILSVVDAYDVMINGRIYKQARSKQEAIGELRRNAGTQFDPKIVELFVKAIMNDEVFSD